MWAVRHKCRHYDFTEVMVFTEQPRKVQSELAVFEDTTQFLLHFKRNKRKSKQHHRMACKTELGLKPHKVTHRHYGSICNEKVFNYLVNTFCGYITERNQHVLTINPPEE